MQRAKFGCRLANCEYAYMSVSVCVCMSVCVCVPLALCVHAHIVPIFGIALIQLVLLPDPAFFIVLRHTCAHISQLPQIRHFVLITRHQKRHHNVTPSAVHSGHSAHCDHCDHAHSAHSCLTSSDTAHNFLLGRTRNLATHKFPPFNAAHK